MKTKLKKTLRKIGSLILITALFLIAFTFPTITTTTTPVYAAPPITIEGENYTTSNFITLYGVNVLPDATTSGGNYVALLTQTAAPVGGYVTTYTVNVPTAGIYNLDLDSTPDKASWASEFDVKVNSGAYQRVINAPTNGTVNATIVKHRLEDISLNAGNNTISFRVTERSITNDNYFVFFLDKLTITDTTLTVKSVSSDANAPLNVYETSSGVAVYFNLNGNASSNTNVSYEVKDYWGSTITSGIATVYAGYSKVGQLLPITLSGHYSVKIWLSSDPAKTVTGYIAVVPPFSTRPALTESPFAIDTAQSWTLASTKINDFASVIKLTGVKYGRDRLCWCTIEQTNGTYNTSNYDSFVTALNNKGIKTLETFADSPAWSHAQTSDTLPQDLRDAYDFTKTMAQHFTGSMPAMEVWNEPDLGSDITTPDQLAAYSKAAAIGIRDSAAGTLVSSPSWTYAPQNYEKAFYQNDMMQYIDIQNFHGYAKYSSTAAIMPFPNNALMQREFNNLYDGQSKYLWMTESSVAIPAPSPTEQTLAQMAQSAQYLVQSTVQSLATGIDKHFLYGGAPSQEGSTLWGLFTRGYMPTSMYVAEAAMTEALGQGVYLGKVLGLPSNVSGYAFTDSTDTVLVFWADASTNFNIYLNKALGTKTNIMGSDSTIVASSGTFNLTASPNPIYLRVTGSIPTTSYEVATANVPFQSAPALTTQQRIVLSQKYAVANKPLNKTDGYQLNNGNTTMSVDVYNFNSTAQNVTVNSSIYGGWSISPANQVINVPANGKGTVNFTITSGSGVLPRKNVPIVFTGTVGGLPIPDSVAYVRMVQQTVTNTISVPGADVPSNWRIDISDSMSPGGSGVITAGSDPGSVQFKWDNSGTGQVFWFPYLMLSSGTDWTQYEGLSFMIYAAADIPEASVLTILNEASTGAKYLTLPGFALKAGWNQIQVPLNDLIFSIYGPADNNDKLDLDDIASIQIGVSASISDVPAYSIKSVGLFGTAQPAYVASTTTISNVSPADTAVVLTASPTISATITDTMSGVDAGRIVVKVDGQTVSSSYNASASTLTASASSLANGVHQLSIHVYNNANEATEWTSSFTVDGSMTDNLNNWSKTYSHTANWAFDTTNPSVFEGDTSRIKRTTNTAENVVYNFSGMNNFTAKIYYYGSITGKVVFYSSPDNMTWTPLALTSDTAVSTGSGWYRINIMPSGNLPAGTNYLGVGFLNDANIWTPQLSSITINR